MRQTQRTDTAVQEYRDVFTERIMAELFPQTRPVDEEQVYFKPTIFIGCGGTGKGIVREVRRRVKQLFGDDSRFQFLFMDTDPRDTEDLEPGEFVFLGGFDPAKFVSPNLPRTIASWWLPGYVPAGGVIDDGARTIRMLGRLAFFYHAGRIRTALLNALNSALSLQRTADRIAPGPVTVHVYVISSLSGGTGSGIFLDTAYMVRELCRQQGVELHMVGVLGWPNIFLDTLYLSPAEQRAVRANGYSAIEELNALMAMERLKFEFDYGDYRVSSQDPVFNQVYIVSSHNEQGLVVPKKEVLFSMIGAAIQAEAASKISQAHEGAFAFSAGRPVQGHTGAYYSSLCAGSIVLPLYTVKRYLALWLAQDALDHLSQQDYREGAASEALSFINAHALNEDGPQQNQVQEHLNRDPQGRPFRLNVPAEDLKQRVNELRNAEAQMLNALGSYEDRFAKIREQMQANAQKLFRDSAQALTNKVAELMTNPQRGPQFAVHFLSAMSELIDLYTRQLQEELNQAKQHLAGGVAQTQSRSQQWAQEVGRASKGMFARRKLERALNEASNDLSRHYSKRIEIALKEEAIRVYEQFREHLNRLMKHLQDLTALMADLQQTLIVRLQEVRHELSALTQLGGGGDSIALSVLDYEGVENLYLQTRPSFETYLGNTLRHLLHTNQGGESPLETIARHFIEAGIEAFNTLDSRNLEEVVRLVYGDEAQAHLERLVNRLLTRVLHPFWTYTATEGVEQNMQEGYYVLLPRETPILTDLISKQVERPQLIEANNPHILLALRVKHRIPMNALTTLPILFEDYEEMLFPMLEDQQKVRSGQQPRATVPPIHIHKDWHKFPDVLPPRDMHTRYLLYSLAEMYGLFGRRKPERDQFVMDGERCNEMLHKIRHHENQNPKKALFLIEKRLQELERQIGQMERTAQRLALSQEDARRLEQMRREQEMLREYRAQLAYQVEQEEESASPSRSAKKRSTSRKTKSTAK